MRRATLISPTGALATELPYAAATELKADFPGRGLDVAVVPSADVRTIEKKDATRVTANLPATSSVLISWRTPSTQPFVVGRARYAGRLHNDALRWTARYDVDVFSAEPLSLALRSSSLAYCS